jgi:hypothetical protein
MSENIFDLVKYRVSRALESLAEARILADSMQRMLCFLSPA